MKKIKITDIHKNDAFFEDRKQFIGKQFLFEENTLWNEETDPENENGFSCGEVLPSRDIRLDNGEFYKKGEKILFYCIKYDEIPAKVRKTNT